MLGFAALRQQYREPFTCILLALALAADQVWLAARCALACNLLDELFRAVDNVRIAPSLGFQVRTGSFPGESVAIANERTTTFAHRADQIVDLFIHRVR